MNYRVLKIQKLFRVSYGCEVVIQEFVGLLEDVKDETLVTLGHPMVVAISIQIVPTIEELLDLELMLLRIANAVVYDTCPVDNYLVIE